MNRHGFQVAFAVQDDHAIVSCRGELDIWTADKLHDAVEHLLAGAPSVVHFDLSDVEFFGAPGVAILVSARIRCEERGIRFEMTASPVVKRLLELVDFDDLVDRHRKD